LEVARQSAFLDVRFRKALAISINKNEMIEYLRNNSVVPAHSGFVPPALFQNARTEQIDYNPNLARQLLQEIGQPVPEFTLSTTADYADLMEYIQHEWEKIGVRCKVQIMQSAAFREASAKGQLQVFRKSWLADYADAENFLAVFNSENFCPDGPNYTHYQNLSFDNMYQQAVKTTQPQERDSLYTLMNTLVSESYVTIPLYYDQVSHFLNTRVKQFPTNSVNMLDLRAVKVNP
jgi:peptide/nickel transport system substrate-binding protein